MVVGVCRLILSIDDAFSIKEKRNIVKSIIARLKSKYNASVAEVGLNDKWKSAVIGIACVSNETSHVVGMLKNMVNFVDNDGRAALVDYTTEIIKEV